MKIDSIKNISFNSNINTDNICINKLDNNIRSGISIPKQKVYASHLGFRGSIPVANLINDYRWFVNHDKTPAIDAFLKIEAPKESLNQLLRVILSNEDSSYQFIDSIVKQPRRIEQFYTSCNEKLPWDADILNIYSTDNMYMRAYENYFDKRYKNASSVSELLTIRPDWKEEVLLNKHRELYHNDDFELGIVPDSIGAENFKAISEYLKQYCFGFKTSSEIPDLNVNGQIFKFKQYIDGKSDKRVFRIDTPNGEKFVIKLQNTSRNSLSLASGLGTVSVVDTYLTRNNCRNAAPIRYYNRNNNIAIYDYINHIKVPQIRFSIQDLADKMPDIKALGITINDTVGTNNYFKLDNSQNALKSANNFAHGVLHDEVVSVDNDHATYNKILLPVINKYFCYLPNEMHMFF